MAFAPWTVHFMEDCLSRGVRMVRDLTRLIKLVYHQLIVGSLGVCKHLGEATGNPVQSRGCPAAVSRNENRH